MPLQLPCVRRASDVCSFERRVDRFSVDKPKPHPVFPSEVTFKFQ